MKNITLEFDIIKNRLRLIDYETIMLAIAYTIIIVTLFYRAFFGVEITDEALYIAEGFLVTKGATPYVDMWLHCSGFALLNAPFIWLYTLINDSTVGLFLYFRIISLIIKILFTWLVIRILRPIIEPKITALWLLPFIAFTPYSILSFSYDTWAIVLLMLAGICLTRAVLSEHTKEKRLYGLIAGMSSALGILSYPITIAVGCSLLIIVLGYEFFYKNHPVTLNKYNVTISFLIGGLATAFVISLFFIIRTGEITGIYDGLKIIIYDNPYHKLSKNITKDSLFLMISYLREWVCLVLISWIILYLPSLREEQKTKAIILYVLAYIYYKLFYILYAYFQVIYTPNASTQIFAIISRILFPLPIVLFPFIKTNKKTTINMLLFLYLPALIYALTASFLVFNGMNTRYYFLIQGTLLVLPFLYWAIKDSLYNNKGADKLAFFITIILSCTLATAFLLNYFGYMYRDHSIPDLNYKIQTGVYKGIYTTLEKGQGLESLEKAIKAETSSNDRILFMDTVPMAYLMTEASHCSPSSWELQQYTYGFKDDTLLRKYFERTGCTPDKIIYIFTGRDKVLSINTEDFKFNEFVNNNYFLHYIEDGYFPIKIYNKRRNK